MNTITMMFKLFTQAGRREVARALIKPYATIDMIAAESANGVCALVGRGAAKMTEEKRKAVSFGCEIIGSGIAKVGNAISPDGEEGVTITDNERIIIQSSIRDGLAKVLTEEIIDDIVETIIARIP